MVQFVFFKKILFHNCLKNELNKCNRGRVQRHEEVTRAMLGMMEKCTDVRYSLEEEMTGLDRLDMGIKVKRRTIPRYIDFGTEEMVVLFAKIQ